MFGLIARRSAYPVSWTRWQSTCFFSTKPSPQQNTIELNNKKYTIDDWTNVTPKITTYLNRGLYLQKDHPLSIVRQQIINYFYKVFVNSKGNPVFSVFDNLNPIVTVQQNFDNLLIPKDHPSRAKSDCYYVNREHLLRAHTTAHQVSGSRIFLVKRSDYVTKVRIF